MLSILNHYCNQPVSAKGQKLILIQPIAAAAAASWQNL